MDKTVDEIFENIVTCKLKTVESLLEVDVLAEFVADYSSFDRKYATVNDLARSYSDLTGHVIKSEPLADSIFKVLQESHIVPVVRVNGCDRHSYYNFSKMQSKEELMSFFNGHF